MSGIKAENQTCQNCKKDFTIDQEDFNFYKKIEVPPPTFCPECRSVRRLCWRNERTLYKSTCGLCKKSIFSIYSPESKYPHFCSECWYSDKWDSMKYGQEYDFSRSFFEQYKDLMLKVPVPALNVFSSKNCDFNNSISRSKDCYLSFRVHSSSNVLYTYRAKPSSYCVDCLGAFNSQFLYECIECTNCSNSQYLFSCVNCTDSKFLFDCRNCLDCFMSSNLRNKQYYFMNERLSKEEYKKKMSEIKISSRKKLDEYFELFKEVQKKGIRKNLSIVNSVNSIGDNLSNCKNCFMCFDCNLIENSRYVMEILTPCQEIMDASSGGESELVYEATGSARSSNVKFSHRSADGTNVEYCFFINSGTNLFGCVGLRHKKYCILNRQYSQKEYEELVPKIIKHMNDMPYIDKAGRVYRYGEFFPIELSPWAYNETAAQENFPINKKIALQKFYSWRDKGERDYKITVHADQLPDDIKDVTDDILNEIIGCAHDGKCYEDLEFCGADCTTAYRIIPAELQFYQRVNLPLPKLCPNCRHQKRLKEKNPNKLWHRTCMCDKQHSHHQDKCNVAFETSYAPDRPEIVYCEKCYQQEVY